MQCCFESVLCSWILKRPNVIQHSQSNPHAAQNPGLFTFPSFEMQPGSNLSGSDDRGTDSGWPTGPRAAYHHNGPSHFTSLHSNTHNCAKCLLQWFRFFETNKNWNGPANAFCWCSFLQAICLYARWNSRAGVSGCATSGKWWNQKVYIPGRCFASVPSKQRKDTIVTEICLHGYLAPCILDKQSQSAV